TRYGAFERHLSHYITRSYAVGRFGGQSPPKNPFLFHPPVAAMPPQVGGKRSFSGACGPIYPLGDPRQNANCVSPNYIRDDSIDMRDGWIAPAPPSHKSQQYTDK